MFRGILAAMAIAAAAIGLSGTAHADVSPGFGAAGLPTSGPYDECPSGTYENSNGDCVERPDSNRSGAIGKCCDGSDTHAKHRSGACSSHGGVCQWFAAAGIPGASDPGNGALLVRRWPGLNGFTSTLAKSGVTAAGL